MRLKSLLLVAIFIILISGETLIAEDQKDVKAKSDEKTEKEDELTLALIGFQETVEQVLHLSLPAHAGLALVHRGPLCPLAFRAFGTWACVWVRDEAVAAAGHGLDILRAGLVAAQGGSDLTQRDSERVFADMDGIPDLFA